MKKQVIKGITMLTMILAIAFATAVVSANAQSANTVVSKIPFEFTVGNTTMPAGKYQINRRFGNSLTIQSSETTTAVIRLSNVIQAGENKHARLLFHRYGERYFLTEVWTGSGDVGHQLMKSRQERAIEREMSSIASKTEYGECGPELVEVAAVLR